MRGKNAPHIYSIHAFPRSITLTKQELKDKIISTFKHGMLDFESDNPILFTTRFYLISDIFGLLNMGDYLRQTHAIIRLERLENGNIVPGLFNRHPGENGRSIDHDDYVGLILSSKLFNESWIANDIYRYGQKHFYSYDNKTMKFNLLEMRQPFDVHLYRAIAARPIGVIGIIGIIHHFLKILLYFFQNKTQTSSKLLDVMRLEALRHKWYMRPHIWLFNMMLKHKYENGIEDLIKIYHYTKPDLQLLARGYKYVRHG